MHQLLCLLGLHRYRKPTHFGGMRCRCGRIRYPIQCWTPSATVAGTSEEAMSDRYALARIPGLPGGSHGPGTSPGARADGAVNVLILTAASESDLRQLGMPGLELPGSRPRLTGRDPGRATATHAGARVAPASPPSSDLHP